MFTSYKFSGTASTSGRRKKFIDLIQFLEFFINYSNFNFCFNDSHNIFLRNSKLIQVLLQHWNDRRELFHRSLYDEH